MIIRKELDQIKIKTDFKRKGLDCCFDPFRKKLIPTTREEIVRQKTALYFRDALHVPEHLIFTEDALSHWGSQVNGRADIVIGYEKDDRIYCLGIIECKAGNVRLSDQTFDQCRKYLTAIDGKYLFITNGIELNAWKRTENDKFKELETLPSYSELLNGNIRYALPILAEPQRIQLSEIMKMTRQEFLETGWIGEDTPAEIMPHIINLGDCLMDVSHKIPMYQYGSIQIIEDLGVSFLNYTDASGGCFGTGNYRSILVQDAKSDHQIISFSILATGKNHNDPVYGNTKGKSVLAVSLQDFDIDYTVLQVNLNEFLKLQDNRLFLRHNGAVMMKGAKKERLLKLLVDTDRSLVRNSQIELGDWPENELLFMDSQDIVKLIGHLLQYSMVRHEYKQYIRKMNSPKKLAFN